MSIKILYLCPRINIETMEQDNLPLGMVVGQMMHEMLRVLKNRDIEQAEVILSIEQHAVLHILNERESDVILNEMAEAMGKDKSAILRILMCLKKKN